MEQNNIVPAHIDLRIFVDSSKESWGELVSDGDSFPVIVAKLVKLGIYLPDEISYKIATNYLMATSQLLAIAPILLLHGKEGTGKSSLGVLASKLHDSPIFSASSTFAAIRNHLTKSKFTTIRHETVNATGDKYYGQKKVEKDLFLVWDDIDPTLLNTDKNLYRMLKNGYNRETSITQIASEKTGENQSFDTFSLKLLGTVSNLTTDSRYREMARRCLTIETAKCPDSFHPIDYSLYDWDGLNNLFIGFWNDLERVKEFPKIIKAVKVANVAGNYPVNSNQLTISRELIAIGTVGELFPNLQDALDIWAEYWNGQGRVKKISQQKLTDFLEALAHEEIREIKAFNEKHNTSIQVTIKNSDLKATLNDLLDKGDIDSYPLPKEISKVFLSLGFYQDSRNNWIKKE